MLINVSCIVSQSKYDFGFARNDSMIVIQSNDTLLFPWAGGMNSCHFAEIDLDLDGKKDLVIFDKHGNKILCFVNKYIAGIIKYVFSPNYTSSFPKINEWIICRDYNCDGKEDIFTYSDNGGGIKVYKNVSDVKLKFEVAVEPYLTYMANIPINIWLTGSDYPVIDDVDNDGDLDILTFGVLGKYLSFYKNLSAENGDSCSGFDFVKEHSCWGYFAENESSNILQLNDTSCISQGKNLQEIKHTGSTTLAFGHKQNGTIDLLLGDVDFSNVFMLSNTGNIDSSYISSVDTIFPFYNTSIYLPSFPVVSKADVDNDGIKDFIVSSFDSRYNIAKSHENTLLYKNIGSNQNPVLSYQSNNFIQKDMIDVGSGAYPTLFDYNNDSLLDLFVGNYGYYDTSIVSGGILKSTFHSVISLYKNIGTSNNPIFELITTDYLQLSNYKLLGISPTFGDLDNDGDKDMLIGNSKGTLWYFENTATTGLDAVFILRDTNYFHIDVGEYSVPQLYDLNNDGLLDIIIGKSNGKISYYQNSGTTIEPQYSLTNENLGNVDIRNSNISYYGYSTPQFFRDSANNNVLFIGNEEGKIFYFKNIDGNLYGSFSLVDTMFYVFNNKKHTIDCGMRSSIAIADINSDGYKDILCGNFSGGLSYFNGIAKPFSTLNILNQDKENELMVRVYPNPASDMIWIEVECCNIEDVNINIINNIGQVLHSQVLTSNKTSFKISKLPKGIYLCLITTSKKHSIFKFVVR